MPTRATVPAIALALLAAGAADAHPHIFIDSGVHPIFGADGRLAAVRVVWAYDELYSLLTLEDLGLDHDYDGALTPEELGRLDGFDMDWMPGYDGDLYVLVGGASAGLSGPVEHRTEFADGRIVTTHVRTLDTPVEVGAEPVVFQVYDPTFYTAYHITLPTRIEGRGDCTAKTFVPDLTEANQALLDALAELGADESIENYDFPAVGADFAEEIRLTCALRS